MTGEPTITGDCSRDEIESLLRAETVPIRVACRTPDDVPWLLSLWYRYRDGALECATSATADVVDYLAHDDRVAFEVSTNDPPYRGVRGHGTARVRPDEGKVVLRALLERYLGTTDTPLGRRLLAEERDEVAITIEPARLYGWNYEDRMRTDPD